MPGKGARPALRRAPASWRTTWAGSSTDKPVAAVPLECRGAAGPPGRAGRLPDRRRDRPRPAEHRLPRPVRPAQQPVALKVFPPGLCTRDEWEARLRRGADLWAALAHPHIVPVQRAGWWDESPVRGPGVRRRTAAWPPGSPGQPHPVREALRLVEQLAEIVGYLHRQGVVHGNLKPSNVLLAADGIPRVADFRPTGGLFQGPLPADDGEPAGLRLPGPRAGRRPERRAAPLHGHLRPGADPVRAADRPAAVCRSHRAGSAGAGAQSRPGPALAPQPRGDAAPGQSACAACGRTPGGVSTACMTWRSACVLFSTTPPAAACRTAGAIRWTVSSGFADSAAARVTPGPSLVPAKGLRSQPLGDHVLHQVARRGCCSPTRCRTSSRA